MLPGRAVDAAGAVGCRSAPDALVRAGAVTVLARRGMDASRPVGRRAAPFTVLLVIAMLVLPRRRVDASAPVARRSAMPAFRTHDGLLLQMNHHAHFALWRSFHVSIRLAKFSILSPNACSFRIAFCIPRMTCLKNLFILYHVFHDEAPPDLSGGASRLSRGEADLRRFVSVLLDRALLLQGRDAIHVGLLLGEIELLLANRPEIAGRKILESLERRVFVIREPGLEHPLEKDLLPRVVQIVELDLEGEPAHDRRIEILAKVGGGHHDSVEVLHLLQKFVHLRDLPALHRHLAALHKTVHLVEEQDRMLHLGAAEGPRDVLLGLADPLGKEIASLDDQHLPIQRLPEVLAELALPRAGGAVHEDVHPGLVHAGGVEAAVEIIPDGLHDLVRLDLALDVEPVQRIILRGQELLPFGNPHELAVGLHEGRHEIVDPLRLRIHALDVRKHRRDATGAGRILRRVFLDLLIGDQTAQLVLGDEILPDRGALRHVQALEADRVVEAAAHGLVHVVGRRIGNPDRRDLHVVQDGVHDALLRRTASADRKSEHAEAARAPAQKFVRLVDDDHAARGILLLLANLNADHSGGGVHVPAVFITLTDLEGLESHLPGETARKRGLPRTRRTVEEDIQLAVARAEHLLDGFAVLLRKLAVVVPRQDVRLVALLVEAAFNGVGVRAVDVPADGPAVEVPVAVEQVELSELPRRRHDRRNLGKGTVKRHRIIEGLFKVLDAARPVEAGLALHVGERQHLALKVGELQKALQVCKARRQRLVLFDLAVLKDAFLDAVEDNPASGPRLGGVPDRAENRIQRIGEIQTAGAGTRLLHVLDLLRRIGRFDELDRLVMIEAVPHDVEEVVVVDVAHVVLDHIAPVSDHFIHEIRLRNLFELSHGSVVGF